MYSGVGLVGIQKKIIGLAIIIPLIVLSLVIAKVFTLHSSYFDLGIFDSKLYRISKYGEWQLAFAGHIHWFELPFAWFCGLFPETFLPYLLVSMQMALLFLPAIWFYKKNGVFVSFAYVLYYPVWANTFFDFHFDHLVVPLLFFFYSALMDRRIWWAVLSAMLIMFVKEPFALQTAACGVLFLCCAISPKSIWSQQLDSINHRKLIIGGVWLIGIGLGYFYFAINYLLPYFTPESWGSVLGGKAFGWLGKDIGEIIWTIFSEPHTILIDIFSTPKKIIYLAVVFGLTGFIALLRPIFLVPAIPPLAIAMLSRLPNYYDYNTHYTAGLIIPVMIAFVYGLPQAERIWGRVVAWSMIAYRYLYDSIHSLINIPKRSGGIASSIFSLYFKDKSLKPSAFYTSKNDAQANFFYKGLFCFILCGHVFFSPSPISRLFWSDKVWSYSWQAYVPTDRDSMIKTMVEKYIPADFDVSVTTQNTINSSHLAHRRTYLPFPMGIFEPYQAADSSSFSLHGFWLFLTSGDKAFVKQNFRYADYVILDLKRPYFLVDKGCEWIYGVCNDKSVAEKFLSLVHSTYSVYDKVFEQDDFIILRRRP